MRVCSADEKRSFLTKLGFSFLKFINHIILISLLDDTMNPCVEIEKKILFDCLREENILLKTVRNHCVAVVID